MSRYDIALGKIVESDSLTESLLVDLNNTGNEDDQRMLLFDAAFQLYQQGAMSIGTILSMLNSKGTPETIRRYGYHRIYNE